VDVLGAGVGRAPIELVGSEVLVVPNGNGDGKSRRATKPDRTPPSCSTNR
jgi:hypothetical protein